MLNNLISRVAKHFAAPLGVAVVLSPVCLLATEFTPTMELGSLALKLLVMSSMMVFIANASMFALNGSWARDPILQISRVYKLFVPIALVSVSLYVLTMPTEFSVSKIFDGQHVLEILNINVALGLVFLAMLLMVRTLAEWMSIVSQGRLTKNFRWIGDAVIHAFGRLQDYFEDRGRRYNT